MKKGLKIAGGIIIVIVLAIVLIPIFFQDKIVELVKQQINKNVNAEVAFTDANLSLFRSFPNASLVLSDLSVVNVEPFAGDTLLYAKTLDVDVPLMDAIKGEKISINSFSIDKGFVNILVNEKGEANYDIAKKNDEENTQGEENSTNDTSIAIRRYEIKNAKISYFDAGGIKFALNDFNHSGSGDLSSDNTKLKTKTSSLVSFEMDKKSYLKNIPVQLDALLDLDLKNMKFSFLENEALVNNLPLTFNGFVKMNESNQEVDLTFNTPSSDFSNFLALIPEEYMKDISSIKTTGNFIVDGKIVGIVDEKHIPKMDINIKSDNASFKFPELPKSIENIYINTTILNTSGVLEDTEVDLKKLSFKIDDNTFVASGKVFNLMTNPLIKGEAKGKLNLAHIDKVYPIEMKNKLNGLISADMKLEFDMEAIQKNIVSRIQSSGDISLSDFEYKSEEMMHPMQINMAKLDLQPSKIILEKFDAKTGSTDLQATGTLTNLLGFLLTDNKDLQGNFTVNSSNFILADFMDLSSTEEDKEKQQKTATEGELKIPSFLDISANVNAKKVVYDNLTLDNVKGALILKDQKAILKDVQANMFDGSIALNGDVNTQPKEPTFDMSLSIKDVDVVSSVTNIEMLRKLAPIASIIEGKLNTKIDLKGNLDNEFSPKLSTIAGEAFAEVLTDKLNPEKSPAMKLLADKISFIDLNKLNLKDLKAHLNFENGKVNVKPFKIKYKDITISLGGSHSFENEMNYNVVFDVPAKYLGSDVTRLLSGANAGNMTVPITAVIGGHFDKPTVSTDLASAAKNLASQLIEQQKGKVVNKLFDKFLGGKEETSADSLTNDSTQTNTTTTDKKPAEKEIIKEGAKDLLNNLFKKKQKK